MNGLFSEERPLKTAYLSILDLQLFPTTTKQTDGEREEVRYEETKEYI
jgi:hypothetical protein